MLPYVDFIYNTTVHRTTQTTPFSLVFGQECQFPIDLFYPKPHDQERSQGEFIDWLEAQFCEALANAREQLGVNQQRQKELYFKKFMANLTKLVEKFGFTRSKRPNQKSSLFPTKALTLSRKELQKSTT